MRKSNILKINFDEDEDIYLNFKIFEMYSNVPDYELVYWINKELDIYMKKEKKEISDKEFPFFYYEDDYSKYQLIKNRVYFEEKKEENLFQNSYVENFYYLYENKKEIDYFFIVKEQIKNPTLDRNLNKVKNLNGVLMINKMEYGQEYIDYINLDKKINFS